MNQITQKRETLKKTAQYQSSLTESMPKRRHAEKALKSLRAGEIRDAKTLFYAANTYCEWAERDVKQTES